MLALGRPFKNILTKHKKEMEFNCIFEKYYNKMRNGTGRFIKQHRIHLGRATTTRKDGGGRFVPLINSMGKRKSVLLRGFLDRCER